MMRRVLAACLGVALAVPAAAQAPAAGDPEVARGIQMVEDGDYDAAILTLDNATRRLATQAPRTRELSQAYLYLGVAYVGKGHEAAAKAKFREAVMQLHDLTLTPDKFPPKVIDLFEAAREEVQRAPQPSPTPAAAAAPAAATAAPARKGGGGKKVLIIGALGAAAAGGAVVALRKNDDGGCDSVFANRSGPLSRPNDTIADLTGGPAIEAGVWFAELSWTGGGPETDVILRTFDGAGSMILDGGIVAAGHRKAEWNGQAGVIYMARAVLVAGGPVSFELSITGPCINTP
jgi:hypothetical protein